MKKIKITDNKKSPKMDWLADNIITPFISILFISIAIWIIVIAANEAKAYSIQTNDGFKILTERHEELHFDGISSINIEPFHQKQRVIDSATELIKSFEGFIENCYKDTFRWVNGKKVWVYSQGYGHQCVQNRVTKEWSTHIVRKAVAGLYGQIEPLYPLATESRLIGLISYDYNTPHTRPVLKYNKKILNEDIEYIRNHMARYNTPQGGHIARREIELNLIFNNNIR